jgi:putative hydrolase of the HAD superfamily
MSIRNIVFDVGGVLVEWRPHLILSALYPNDRAKQDLVRSQVFANHGWAHVVDRGLLDERQVVLWFQSQTGLPGPDMQRLFRLVHDLLEPIPASLELLRELSAAGLNLYCLSNMPEFTWRYLQKTWDFWSLFKGVVVSCHLRKIKPEPEIYQHLMQQYSLRPEECVFIDDREENANGARAVGMHAFVFRGADDCRANLKALGVPLER